MRFARRTLALRTLVILCALALSTTWLQTAVAAPPLRLDAGPITDDARVLGDDTEDVEAALARLNDEHRIQLFVVLVQSFDEIDSNEWANETASINGLGLNDILIAVATVDRQYAWSIDDDFPLSDEVLNEVAATMIEPRLQDGDYADAIIAAADGYREALDDAAAADGSAATVGTSESGSGGWFCPIAGGLVVLIGGALALLAIKRNKRGGGTGTDTRGAADEPSMKDLEVTAGKLLVDLDDALRSSEQELGFAEAEFGAAAINEYRAVLKQSGSDAAEAFRIQQQVFDSEPETEAERRAMLQRIIELAGAADARLDEKAASFARLRDLAGRSDEVVAATAARLDRVDGLLPAARATLAKLKETYLPSALGEVADDDEQAAAQIASARAALADATAANAAGERNTAALSAKVAEDATTSAEQLLAAIDAAAEQLKTAQQALAEETTRLEGAASVMDAQGHAALIATAGATASAAREALAAPPFDPLAHLNRVREVAEQLDAALAEARDEAQKADAARAAVTGAVTSARDRIAAADSFIATRSRTIGSEARSSLSEAKSRLQRAEQMMPTDAAAALPEARAALQYAESALRYAQGNAASQVTTSSVGPIGFGGSSTRRSGGGGTSSPGSSAGRSSSSSRSTKGQQSSGERRGGGGRY